MPLQTQFQRPLQKALNWTREQMRLRPDLSLTELVDEASRRFSLGPLDGEFLHRILRRAEPPESGR